jgi:DNA primase
MNTTINAAILKSTINPLEYYGHELTNARLTKPEWNEGGLCPFHADRTPGSFHVNLETGGFKCFSCGASGGDIIAFTIEKYGIGFVDALKKLSHEWGVK